MKQDIEETIKSETNKRQKKETKSREKFLEEIPGPIVEVEGSVI